MISAEEARGLHRLAVLEKLDCYIREAASIGKYSLTMSTEFFITPGKDLEYMIAHLQDRQYVVSFVPGRHTKIEW